MYCNETSLVKIEANRRTVRALRCRCWHCEVCQPDRVLDLKGLGKRGHPNMFLTLTVNPSKFTSPADRANQLVRAWRLLRVRIEKRWGIVKLPFLAIFELTKKGEPHLHILCRSKFIPQWWLSQQMADLIGAPIVDVRRVTNLNRALAYVTKYISKAPTKWEGCKRYWRSQNYELDSEKYVKPPSDPNEWWEVRNIRPGLLLRLAELDGGYVVHDKNKWFIYPHGPPFGAEKRQDEKSSVDV